MMAFRPAIWLALSALSLPAFAQDTGVGESPVDDAAGESPVDDAADEPGESPMEPGAATPDPEGELDAPLPPTEDAPPASEPTPTEAGPATSGEGTAVEVPADEVDREPSPEPPAPRTGPGVFAGLHFGPAFALSPLSTSVLPRLEVGVELPWAQRRIRPFFSVAHSRPIHEGTQDDDRVEGGSWSHDLRQAEWTLSLGGWVAVLEPGSAPVIPEVAIAPQIFLQQSRINGEAGGAEFPESREVYTKGGVLLAAGARYPVGPGEVAAHLGWHTSKLDGVITGDSTAMQLMLTAGYRLVF